MDYTPREKINLLDLSIDRYRGIPGIRTLCDAGLKVIDLHEFNLAFRRRWRILTP